MIIYSYTEKLMVNQWLFAIEINLGHKGIDKYIYISYYRLFSTDLPNFFAVYIWYKIIDKFTYIEFI